MQPSNEEPFDRPEVINETASEPVWTYRGYRLTSSEFNTAMVHLYRGEISRANVWRQRLDATTNWAVVTTGATITFAFSQTLGHHGVIILNTLLVSLFLYIEARRYLNYEVWSYRIRLMETDFFAGMLVPPFRPSADWAEGLAENLLHPHHPISMWEGFGRRFRRNYMWIFIILALAWAARVILLPSAAVSWADFLARAAIGGIPGWLVLAAGLGYNGLLFLVGFATVGMQKATGEILPHFPNGAEQESGISSNTIWKAARPRAWFRTSYRRQQYLAYIITDHPQAVADRILQEMNRGVTGLQATGMYTGAQHPILLCALTVTEVKQLEALVGHVDPAAFVIISPVREILGKGFFPVAEQA